MNEEITAFQKFVDTVIEFAVNYSFQVLGAMIVLIAGFILAQWLSGFLLSILKKKDMDITLSKFLASCLRLVVIAFAIIIALGKFGITIAPFIAALSAMALGASLAIQGPLSNYGAGLSIILTRPFVVGNTVTVAGVSGVVTEVTLSSTILTNEDGVKITIPNKHIVGEILQNSGKNRIVEGVIGISYDSDASKAVRVIQKVLATSKDAATDPKPQVGIQDFGDSAVNIAYRYWVPTAKYFQCSYEVNLAVYQAVQDAGIIIPFPQRDVRIVSQPGNLSK